MGEIIAKDMDSWESTVSGLPYGMYIYILDNSVFNTDAISIIGNCSAIQSVQYSPFIDLSEATTWVIPYDVERFGNPETIRPKLDTTPSVFRLIELDSQFKNLGRFKTYDISGVNIGGVRNWRNESRLYNYPYSFAILTDHINPPMTVKYHLCRPQEYQDVWAKPTISDRCSYSIFIEGYKGDTFGKTEAIVSGDAHELPCSSSAYSQWFASSKNQTHFGMTQALDQSFLRQAQGQENSQFNALNKAVSGLTNTVGSAIFGGLMGGIVGGATNVVNTGMGIMQNNITQNQLSQTGNLERQGIIGGVLAQKKDLRSTPHSLLSRGSDIIFGLENGEKRLDIIRYGLQEQFYKQLGDYFAMFGYKVNRIRNINRRDRYYYNYIKTVGINTYSTFSIPKKHLEIYDSIFDNGVTIWHIDREGVEVLDYSMDNYEV